MKKLSFEQERRQEPIALTEKRQVVAGKEITYSLGFLPRERAFFITVSEETGERGTAPVGHDLFRAERMLDLLVRNTVTLCHFRDVIEDLSIDPD